MIDGFSFRVLLLLRGARGAAATAAPLPRSDRETGEVWPMFCRYWPVRLAGASAATPLGIQGLDAAVMAFDGCVLLVLLVPLLPLTGYSMHCC